MFCRFLWYSNHCNYHLSNINTHNDLYHYNNDDDDDADGDSDYQDYFLLNIINAYLEKWHADALNCLPIRKWPQ